MIEEPARYVENFVKAGADIITIHYEADKHLDRTINYIKSFGIKAGIALNPATPVSNIKHIISEVDMVLIMSVNPGFGGQKYIEYCGKKIKEVKNLSEIYNKDLLIEVDGGIGIENIKKVVECGANVIVAGSAVFKNGDIEKNIKDLKEGF
jgi:ribulose-phosphate 3-epimerase